MIVLKSIFLFYLVHWLYMALGKAKEIHDTETLTLYWKAMIYPALGLFLVLDLLLNYTVGFIFGKPVPYLFSNTVQHYVRSTGWRQRLAFFYARQLNLVISHHIRV